MGLTIHWDLEFGGTDKEVVDKLNQLKEVAEQLPLADTKGPRELDYDDFTERYKTNNRYKDWRDWACIQGGFCDGKRVSKAFCLHLWPGEGCEAMNIGLRTFHQSSYRDHPHTHKHWIWHSFCKTQYAEEFVKCHLLVIRILDECKKLEILKEVHDEGHYWETRNLEKLAININASTEQLQKLFGQLSKTWEKENLKADITKRATHVTKLEVDTVKKLNSPLPPDSNN